MYRANNTDHETWNALHSFSWMFVRQNETKHKTQRKTIKEGIDDQQKHKALTIVASIEARQPYDTTNLKKGYAGDRERKIKYKQSLTTTGGDGTQKTLTSFECRLNWLVPIVFISLGEYLKFVRLIVMQLKWLLISKIQ